MTQTTTHAENPARPRRRAVLITLVIVAAIVVLGVLGIVVAASLSATDAEAQNAVLDRLGDPARFTIIYLPRTTNGAEEVVRTELWDYPDHQQRITFVEGAIAAVDTITPDPEDATYLAVSPPQFDLEMGLEQVAAALGETPEKVDELPEFSAKDGVELYLSDHAMFALEGGKLVFLQTIGRSKSLASAEETAAARWLYPVFVGNAWGYIDGDGATVVEPRFQAAEPMSEGLAAVLGAGGKWGFIDDSGATAIQPRFGMAMAFHDGMAAAAENDLWGYVDTSGQWVIKPSYAFAGDFGDGMAPVSDGSAWRYVDRSGKPAFEGTFEDAKAFSGGLAPVRISGKYGYIDSTGRTAIEPRFTSAEPFSEGHAAALDGRAHGLHRHQGQLRHRREIPERAGLLGGDGGSDN